MNLSKCCNRPATTHLDKTGKPYATCSKCRLKCSVIVNPTPPTTTVEEIVDEAGKKIVNGIAISTDTYLLDIGYSESSKLYKLVPVLVDEVDKATLEEVKEMLRSNGVQKMVIDDAYPREIDTLKRSYLVYPIRGGITKIMNLSKCCNAEIEEKGRAGYEHAGYCKECGNWSVTTDYTPPTSTEVEEIAMKLSGYNKWLNEGEAVAAKDMMTPDEATQAITQLIQQAELRGDLRGRIGAYNHTLATGFLTKQGKDFAEMMVDKLQAQLTKEDNHEPK